MRKAGWNMVEALCSEEAGSGRPGTAALLQNVPTLGEKNVDG
jgi:hypothetical protein